MSTFDADTTEINAFEVKDANLYIFSQYFDHEEVFDELRECYDSDHYRFEIPADEIDRVESFLDEYFYDLNRIVSDTIEPFCVVKEKYTDHADINLSKGSRTLPPTWLIELLETSNAGSTSTDQESTESAADASTLSYRNQLNILRNVPDSGERHLMKYAETNTRMSTDDLGPRRQALLQSWKEHIVTEESGPGFDFTPTNRTAEAQRKTEAFVRNPSEDSLEEIWSRDVIADSVFGGPYYPPQQVGR